MTAHHASPPPIWRTSSYSGAQHNCVQVAALPGPAIAIRDSKHPELPRLHLSPAAWQRLIITVRDQPQ